MSVDGSYKLTVVSPLGTLTPTLALKADGDALSGSVEGIEGSEKQDFSGTVDGDRANWRMTVMGYELDCSATIDGDSISGTMTNPMGGASFTGEREG